MKKRYINPELKSFKLKTQGMLASSPVENGFNTKNAGTLGGDIVSGNMGRGGWFDEDEE